MKRLLVMTAAFLLTAQILPAVEKGKAARKDHGRQLNHMSRTLKLTEAKLERLDTALQAGDEGLRGARGEGFQRDHIARCAGS